MSNNQSHAPPSIPDTANLPAFLLEVVSPAEARDLLIRCGGGHGSASIWVHSTSPFKDGLLFLPLDVALREAQRILDRETAAGQTQAQGHQAADHRQSSPEPCTCQHEAILGGHGTAIRRKRRSRMNGWPGTCEEGASSKIDQEADFHGEDLLLDHDQVLGVVRGGNPAGVSHEQAGAPGFPGDGSRQYPS